MAEPSFKPAAFFLSNIAFYKPRVLFSACLLGEKVRYDGTDKQHPTIKTFLLPFILTEKLCPEVGAGLGIPRPTLQLVQGADFKNNDNNTDKANIAAINLENPEINATDALKHYSKETVARLIQQQTIDAYILKARSPSCGLNNTPLHDPAGNQAGLTSGIFASELKNKLTQEKAISPFCNEDFLNSENHCRLFLLACLLAKEHRLVTLYAQTQPEIISTWDKHYQQHYAASSPTLLETLMLAADENLLQHFSI